MLALFAFTISLDYSSFTTSLLSIRLIPVAIKFWIGVVGLVGTSGPRLENQNGLTDKKRRQKILIALIEKKKTG